MTPMEWVLSSDTGVSSKTIWAVMMGAVSGQQVCGLAGGGRFDVPHDPSDFGRCFRLLEKFPEWRNRLHEVASVFPKWRPMVDRWGELENMYKEDFPSGKSDCLFELLSQLEDEGRILDGWKQTGKYSWERSNDRHNAPEKRGRKSCVTRCVFRAFSARYAYRYAHLIERGK